MALATSHAELDVLMAEKERPPSWPRWGATHETIKHFNAHAARGQDPDFGKRTDAYRRFSGDLTHRPNPAWRPWNGSHFTP